MLSCARAQGAPGALKERLPGIGGRRQRDQRGEPVKQIARLRRHVGDVARPHRDRQQHDVHRRKAGDRETFQQPLGLAAVVGFGALGRERMGVIADALPAP